MLGICFRSMVLTVISGKSLFKSGSLRSFPGRGEYEFAFQWF